MNLRQPLAPERGPEARKPNRGCSALDGNSVPLRRCGRTGATRKPGDNLGSHEGQPVGSFEQPFVKPKHLFRKAEPRTVGATSRKVSDLIVAPEN